MVIMKTNEFTEQVKRLNRCAEDGRQDWSSFCSDADDVVAGASKAPTERWRVTNFSIIPLLGCRQLRTRC